MKLTVKSLAKRIEEQNEMFERATKDEKCVIIAQDCLDRIQLEQILPNTNRFCKFKENLEYTDRSIKDVLNTTSGVVCKSCAKGSLFMSYIGRTNKITFNQVKSLNDDRDLEHDKLKEIFTLEQLALIEYVFEGVLFITDNDEGKPFYFNEDKVEEFRENIKTDGKNYDTDLMIAICNNIIENKGTFKL